MIQVHTRDGIFGPGGYGGGLFDGSNMGFGGLGATPSRLLSLHGLGASEQAAAGVQGLGALKWMGPTGDPVVTGFQLSVNKALSARGYKTIGTDGQLGPTTCGAWSWLGGQADFVPDAAIQAFQDAMGGDYTLCKAYSNPVKLSTGKPWSTADMGIQQTSVSAPYPWGVSDPRVTDLQHGINTQLIAMGYEPIAVTGRIDAATCGAMQFATAQWGLDFGPNVGANCQAFTAPIKAPVCPAGYSVVNGTCVRTGPVTCPDGYSLVNGVCTQNAAPKPPSSSKASMTGWIVGGLLVAAGVAAYASTKKK
jgi:hypothetical protein